MEKDKNNNKWLPIILDTIILLILFAIILVVLNKKGYLSFNKNIDKFNDNYNGVIDKKRNDSNIDNIVNNNKDDIETKNDENDNNSIVSTNMSTNEVFNLWNKIKGNWADVRYDHDMCVGSSLEINTFIKRAKFNSDGIVVWSITSFEKIGDNQYKINLISPVNLNNEMSGDIVAYTSDIKIDISYLNNKILRVIYDNGYTDYEYVGENKYTNSNHQYIDGGFTQDKYCEWYNNKNN